MPNHVTNKVNFKGEASEVAKVLSFIKGEKEDMYIDFNKIVPMPEGLDIESGSRGDMGYAVITGESQNMLLDIHEVLRRFWKQPLKEKEKCLSTGMKYVQNMEKHGYTTWYDWCNDNWGTKWNAYDQSHDGDTLSFDTAWSPVFNLLIRLSQKFPSVEIDYKYADEDTGSNVGHVSILNGNTAEDLPENQSKEAYEMAFEINPESRQYYELKDGAYEYIED